MTCGAGVLAGSRARENAAAIRTFSDACNMIESGETLVEITDLP